VHKVRRILLSCLAGVVLAVLSAWGFAVFGVFTEGELVAKYDERNTEIPAGLVPEGWDPRSWHYFTGAGIRRDLVSECEWMGSTLGMTMDGRPQRTIIHVSCGWPIRSLTWFDYVSPTGAAPPSALQKVWDGGIDVGLAATPGPSGRFGVSRRVPIRPLWAGLLANVAFWSITAAATGVIAVAWRRARRRKRGLCEACAYPVSGLATCPECGRGPARPA